MLSSQIGLYALGGGAFNTSKSTSATFSSGVVWNLPNVHFYEGGFITGSIGGSTHGGSGFISTGFLNKSIHEGINEARKTETFGITYGRSFGTSSGASLSGTYFQLLKSWDVPQGFSLAFGGVWGGTTAGLVAPQSPQAMIGAAMFGTFLPWTKRLTSKSLGEQRALRPPG